MKWYFKLLISLASVYLGIYILYTVTDLVLTYNYWWMTATGLILLVVGDVVLFIGNLFMWTGIKND